jgi:peptide/nickel transport system permease protein
MSAMSMAALVARRLIRAVTVILGLLVVTFFLPRVASDPAVLILGTNYSEDAYQNLVRELGLDHSLLSQFFSYLGAIAQGDFGDSYWMRTPSLPVVLERLPASLFLAGAGIALGAVLGLALGILGGLWPGTWIDRISTGVSGVSVAVPDFWLGLVLISVFAVQLGWLPTSGYGEPLNVVLPAVTLALLPAGRLARITRQSLIDELSKDYVVAARARGISFSRVVRTHVLRNVAVPATTVLGFDFLLLFAGSAATLETVFSWPGVGQLAVQATLHNDLTLMSAIVVVTGVIVGLGNILLDLLHAALDRRAGS